MNEIFSRKIFISNILINNEAKSGTNTKMVKTNNDGSKKYVRRFIRLIKIS